MASEGLRVRVIHDPHTEPELLEKMIAVEAQKEVGGKRSVPLIGCNTDVFASLFATLGPLGWLRVAVMELGDRLIGWELIFHCGSKLWSYQGAYDREFSRLSPGTMLLPTVIDYGRTHGCTEYDFLGGEETYKLKWATDLHQTYRLLIWNRRWMSEFFAWTYLKFRIHPLASTQVKHSE